MIRIVTISSIALTLVACGESAPDGPIGELERNERLWVQSKPASYVYALERVCFCAPDSLGPVRVRVQGGTVTERLYVDSNQPVPALLEDSFPGVEGLFDLLRSAIDGGAFQVDVTYDPMNGVPTDVFIDFIENAIDDELGIRVTEAVQPT